MDVSQLIQTFFMINWSHQMECEKNKTGHSTIQTNKQKRFLSKSKYINTCSWWREISRNVYHRTPAVAYLSTNVGALPRVSVMLSIRHRTASTPICTRLTGQRGYLTRIFFWMVLLSCPQHHRRLQIPLNPDVLDTWLQVHVSPHIGCQLLAASDSLQQPVATVSQRPLSRTCLSLRTLWRICSDIKRTLLPN
jgi:hypothetical protein